MIVNYVIDWQSIGKRIQQLDRLELLRSHLFDLRTKLGENAVIWTSAETEKHLAVVQKDLLQVNDGQSLTEFSDLLDELKNYQQILDGKAGTIRVPFETVAESKKYINSYLSSHGLSKYQYKDKNESLPFVIIDADSIDRYKFSADESKRNQLKWESFESGDEDVFQLYLAGMSLAASAYGDTISFYDPYIPIISAKNETDWTNSIKAFSKIFLHNRDITHIRFSSRTDDSIKETINENMLKDLKSFFEKERSSVSQPTALEITFEPKIAHSGVWHDRFIEIGTYEDISPNTPCLRPLCVIPSGLDVFKKDKIYRSFQIIAEPGIIPKNFSVISKCRQISYEKLDKSSLERVFGKAKCGLHRYLSGGKVPITITFATEPPPQTCGEKDNDF